MTETTNPAKHVELFAAAQTAGSKVHPYDRHLDLSVGDLVEYSSYGLGIVVGFGPGCAEIWFQDSPERLWPMPYGKIS